MLITWTAKCKKFEFSIFCFISRYNYSKFKKFWWLNRVWNFFVFLLTFASSLGFFFEMFFQCWNLISKKTLLNLFNYLSHTHPLAQSHTQFSSSWYNPIKLVNKKQFSKTISNILMDQSSQNQSLSGFYLLNK